MWLMTKHGFYSIVQRKPDEYHVRARERLDLENLLKRVPLPDAKIVDNVLLKTGEEEDLVETVLTRAASELRGVHGLELDDLVMAFEEVRPVGRIFHDNLFRHASEVVRKLQEERKRRHGRKVDGGNPELEAFVKYRKQAGGERIRWRVLDKDGDGRLADDEMAELVASLRRQPERVLFRCEGEMNPTSHPAYRERILALAKYPRRTKSW
jgi:hypothetical protein